jgi:hypothetical protein
MVRTARCRVCTVLLRGGGNDRCLYNLRGWHAKEPVGRTTLQTFSYLTQP